jgi:hypothetical protein
MPHTTANNQKKSDKNQKEKTSISQDQIKQSENEQSQKIKKPRKTQTSKKNGKKSKKNKTRAPNAFLLFCNDARAEIQSELNSSSTAEVARLLGTKWHFLHPDKKQVYRKKALELRKELEEKNQKEAIARTETTPSQESQSNTIPLLILNSTLDSIGNPSPILSSSTPRTSIVTQSIKESSPFPDLLSPDFDDFPFPLELTPNPTFNIMSNLIQGNLALNELVESYF